jgi:hypothetical protein
LRGAEYRIGRFRVNVVHELYASVELDHALSSRLYRFSTIRLGKQSGMPSQKIRISVFMGRGPGKTYIVTTSSPHLSTYGTPLDKLDLAKESEDITEYLIYQYFVNSAHFVQLHSIRFPRVVLVKPVGLYCLLQPQDGGGPPPTV